MERLICIVIGYAFGLLQTGFLMGKWNKIDIREHGSGNAGTTNAIRTLGWKFGAITFVGDCFKCVLAVVVVKAIYAGSMPQALPLLGLYAGVGAVLGHNFPFYLGFKGGKGVATSVGLLLSTNVVLGLIAILVFGIVLYITKYVSVGSMALLATFAIGIIVYGETIGFDLATMSMTYEMYAIGVGLFLMTVVRHKTNIVRLMNGTESKVGSKKKSVNDNNQFI